MSRIHGIDLELPLKEEEPDALRSVHSVAVVPRRYPERCKSLRRCSGLHQNSSSPLAGFVARLIVAWFSTVGSEASNLLSLHAAMLRNDEQAPCITDAVNLKMPKRIIIHYIMITGIVLKSNPR
jgi:hypothetical protein